MQQIRSAICVPLIGAEDKALGMLYVDNVTATHRFSDDDFEFCIAFAGIAAVAIENSAVRAAHSARAAHAQQLRALLHAAAGEANRRVAGDDSRSAATSVRSPCCSATSAASRRSSETMRPDDMASLLTEYFTEMVECVFRHDGTLDKFIGDAVMAQWGAPIGGPDDADKAMAAAIEMIHELDKLNAQWRADGPPELQIGIGLNYGEAFAGNIGSERRLEFTVIGDTVNTASRLCGAADPREILLSDDFRRALHASAARSTQCPPMELKNKSQPVTVYPRRARLMRDADAPLPAASPIHGRPRRSRLRRLTSPTRFARCVAPGTLYDYAAHASARAGARRPRRRLRRSAAGRRRARRRATQPPRRAARAAHARPVSRADAARRASCELSRTSARIRRSHAGDARVRDLPRGRSASGASTS